MWWLNIECFCVLILYLPAGPHLYSVYMNARACVRVCVSNSLQMGFNVSRSHQSMRVRQLPRSSGLQPNESICGEKQHQVTLPTTQLPLRSRLRCQLRMSHLVLMLCGHLLDWDPHMNQSQCEELYLKICLSLFVRVNQHSTPRNNVLLGRFHTSWFPSNVSVLCQQKVERKSVDVKV